MTGNHTGQQTKSNPRNDEDEPPAAAWPTLKKLEQPTKLNGIQNFADPPAATDQRQ